MEQWQIEIKRLDKIRLTLGLNYSKLQVLVNKDRGYLKRIFELQTVPSLSVYFELKMALENEFEVKFSKIEPIPLRDISFMENAKEKVLPPKTPTRNTNYDACDCKLENGLLKRGKIKCALTKVEHQF